MNYSILNIELLDVKYSSMTDIEATIDLNILNIIRIKSSMTGNQLLESQDSTEFIALSDGKKSQWLALCGLDLIDPQGQVIEIVKDIWGIGSVTISNLSTNRNETISRGMELGLGLIRERDIRFARSL